jgi:hypothetical protein
MAEQPFTVSIPDAEIELLRSKLALTRLPDELDESGWEYGSPLADVKRLVERWQNDYDWRRHEAEINQLSMFTRDIEVEDFGTLNIHYVHQKSDVKNAIPLLFVHGCTYGSCMMAYDSSDMMDRAGPFYGGQEDSPPSYSFFYRSSELPCGGYEPTWLWIL